MYFPPVFQTGSFFSKSRIWWLICNRLFTAFADFVWFSYFSHLTLEELLKRRRSIRSYTIKIFFLSNSFFQPRHLRSNWDHSICADLFRSDDLLQNVLEAFYFLKVFFFGAGGHLLLCSDGSYLKKRLHLLDLIRSKTGWRIQTGGCIPGRNPAEIKFRTL